jgi:hypothetical protein
VVADSHLNTYRTPILESQQSDPPHQHWKTINGQTADAARDTAVTLDKWLRTKIEAQPYTAALVAFGIGWLLGRAHRPL